MEGHAGEYSVRRLKGDNLGNDRATLLGVGYIIGPRIASIMRAGGVLSYLVLIPAIKFFGDNVTGTGRTRNPFPSAKWDPTIFARRIFFTSAREQLLLVESSACSDRFPQSGMDCEADYRICWANTVCADMRLGRIAICRCRVVVIGCLAIIAIIMAVPQLHLRGNLLGAFLIVLFSFLFVTVSSRLTGEIGSSSTPISGMTVATLLLTCLAFLIVGWTAAPYFVTALSIGGIVCIAASNGGTTSQDLKTGFLVGSTPRSQQIAILFGSLASALTLGYVLLFLNDAYTVYVPVPANTQLRAPANEIGKAGKVQGYRPLRIRKRIMSGNASIQRAALLSAIWSTSRAFLFTSSIPASTARTGLVLTARQCRIRCAESNSDAVHHQRHP